MHREQKLNWPWDAEAMNDGSFQRIRHFDYAESFVRTTLVSFVVVDPRNTVTREVTVSMFVYGRQTSDLPLNVRDKLRGTVGILEVEIL